MSSLAKKPLRLGASVAASVLETAAERLRRLAPDQPEAGAEPVAPAAPEPTHETRGAKPAAGTRARISNPKAARKVRSREA